MVAIIEDEGLKLVEYFKKLLQDNYNYETTDVRRSTTLNNNTGQIYKLQKRSKNNLKKLGTLRDELNVIEDKTPNRKVSTVADLYMKAEDYAEVRKVYQSTGMIVSMHDAFGVTVLNTLWRMMAGKRSAFPIESYSSVNYL